MCETFNSKLVDGRDKPIITALEYIREYLMKRIVNVQKVIEKADGPLTPSPTKILDSIKSEAIQYTVIWNGGDKYQVKGPWMEQCVVDMKEKVCSCRRWELTGFPCKHAVASIWNMALNGHQVGLPEDWVHPAYWLQTWKEVYSFKIDPINGRSMWPRSQCPATLIPPLHHKQVGRPKKKRRKTDEEMSSQVRNTPIVQGGRLSRVGKSVTCAKCKKKRHNSRSCKGQGGSRQSEAGGSQASEVAAHGGGRRQSQAGGSQRAHRPGK